MRAAQGGGPYVFQRRCGVSVGVDVLIDPTAAPLFLRRGGSRTRPQKNRPAPNRVRAGRFSLWCVFVPVRRKPSVQVFQPEFCLVISLGNRLFQPISGCFMIVLCEVKHTQSHLGLCVPL